MSLVATIDTWTGHAVFPEKVRALKIGSLVMVIGTHDATFRGYNESHYMLIIKCRCRVLFL
jgi:hypothetical protein